MLLAFLQNLVTVGMTIEEQIYNIFYVRCDAKKKYQNSDESFIQQKVV